MGDRWNIHHDEEQARRYREAYPLWTRVLRHVRGWAIIGMVIAVAVTLGWLWNHQ